MNLWPNSVNTSLIVFIIGIALSACGGGGGGSNPELSSGSAPTSIPSATPTMTPSATPTPTLIPSDTPSPIANGESITVQAEEAALLTDEMASRSSPEVQVIGGFASWIIADQDGVEFTAPINAESLTIGYISGTGGVHSIYVDGVLVGEFNYVQNSSDWQNLLPGLPTEVSFNMSSTLFEGSSVRVLFKDSNSGSANIDYLTFNSGNVDTSTPTPTPTATPVGTISAKYMPEGDAVLVFAGQDNETVGGNGRFNNGYIENVGIPSGITHYVGMRPGQPVGGMENEQDWTAGPMHLKAYVDSSTLDGTIMHIAIDMVGVEDQIANGGADAAILELANFLSTYSDTPFLIRIGYEFDGGHNGYQPEPFKAAWKRIVNMLDDEGVTNFATMLHAITLNTSSAVWNAYYPEPDENRDNYVDWLGYSYFAGQLSDNANALTFARQVGKPICICESSPVRFDVDVNSASEIWNGWFVPVFNHIEANTDVIKAIAYINLDWPSQGLWVNNGFFNTTDATLQKSPDLLGEWLDKMNEDTYIHTNIGVYDMIDFVPQ